MSDLSNSNNRKAFLLRIFLLWLSRPSQREPDEDGSYFIGCIEDPRLQDQRLKRETPYSVCQGIRNDEGPAQPQGSPWTTKIALCGLRVCPKRIGFVNDLEEPEPPSFWGELDDTEET